MRKMWRKQKIATVAEKSEWSRVFENRAIRAIYNKDLGENFVPVPASHELTPAELRKLAKKYTIADLLEVLKDERLDRYWIEQLVKAGATRLDDIRMPRNTVTFELLQSLPKRTLLALPADTLPWIRGYNFQNALGYDISRERELTVKDIIGSDEATRCFGPTTVTKNAQLFKALGFTSKNCSFIRQAMKKEHRERIHERGLRLIALSKVEFD